VSERDEEAAVAMGARGEKSKNDDVLYSSSEANKWHKIMLNEGSKSIEFSSSFYFNAK
jgi:CO dehydrogenase/acetyl-CoA synthase delta subunit